MIYNGKELKEFTSDKPVVFDPPKKMLVWDNAYDGPIETDVLAYLPRLMYPAITTSTKYAYCAEIPEQPKDRRATNRELSRWLVMGNGEALNKNTNYVYHANSYYKGDENDECNSKHFVRKWGDEEWHEPTADYMGLREAGNA